MSSRSEYGGDKVIYKVSQLAGHCLNTSCAVVSGSLFACACWLLTGRFM